MKLLLLLTPAALLTLFLAPGQHCRAADSAATASEARSLVIGIWQHGIPYARVHDLGSEALPALYQVLADPGRHFYWSNTASAIGFIGDPEAFDTLRNFVWERFSGEVDQRIFSALLVAQAAMGAIAATSPRILRYLEETAEPQAWKGIRWSYKSYSGERLAERMSLMTIQALSVTASDEARQILHRLHSEAPPGRRRQRLDEAIRTNEKVISLGLREYMRRSHGGAEEYRVEDWFGTAGSGTGPAPPEETMAVTSSRGALYFGGNRLDPPYRIEYINGVLSVNDRALTPISKPAYVPTARDSALNDLRQTIWTIIRTGLTAGESDASILDNLRRGIGRNPLVESVHLSDRDVGVYLREDYPVFFPLPDPGSSGKDAETVRITLRNQRLMRIKSALDGGATVFIGRKVEATFPAARGAKLDAALLVLRRNEELSHEEKQTLGSVTRAVREEIMTPIVLVPARQPTAPPSPDTPPTPPPESPSPW